MDKLLITFLLDMAVKFSGLPPIPLDQLPAFERVSPEQMQAEVCPEAPIACRSIVAVFDTERYRILFLDSLDLEKSADNSFLVHELVHALQYRQRGEAIYADCRALLATEQQAYDAQNGYLKREGQFMRVGEVLRFTTCAQDKAIAAHRD